MRASALRVRGRAAFQAGAKRVVFCAAVCTAAPRAAV